MNLLKIRVSIGTAAILNLTRCRLDVPPTTAYFMTNSDKGCRANCGFCSQAKESTASQDLLSRVVWPSYPLNMVLDRLKNACEKKVIYRTCIQVLNYPNFFTDLVYLVNKIKSEIDIPISVSCQPLKKRQIKRLYELGLNRIGIPIDAATPELFEKVKGKKAGGPYRWNKHFESIRQALKIFGRGRVSTHLIVGLGETEREMVKLIQLLANMGVLPGLFAFTPIKGTRLSDKPRPSLSMYRRVQLARYLIVNEISKFEEMDFDNKGRIINFGIDKKKLLNIVNSSEPFLTSGCPKCNRPFYNERPSGPLYNFPRNLIPDEINEIKHELSLM